MTLSKIEWTDRSDWNPIRGCTRVSPGCGGPGLHGGCYAEAMAARFSDPGMWGHGFAERTKAGGRWTGNVAIQWDRIALPLSWRKPARIFASSTSDWFHEALPPEEIATLYAVAVAAHHLRGHTFQILTKRTERMCQIMTTERFWNQVNAEAGALVMEAVDPLDRRSDDARATLDDYDADNPPPGIWMGTSCEDQTRADERIPDLLATPAAVRFVSYEPALGPIDFRDIDINGDATMDALSPSSPLDHWNSEWDPAVTGTTLEEAIAGFEDWGFSYPPSDKKPRGIDWLICGGESGHNARPMHPDWARSVRDQCAAAGVPFFFKQWGEWKSHKPAVGGDLGGDIRAGRVAIVHPSGDDGTRIFQESGGRRSTETGSRYMARVGKHAAGRLLDGVEHNSMPEIRK